MKLSELKKTLESYDYPDYDDPEVVIPISQPSIGAEAVVKVQSVSRGFDWDHGHFRIRANVPLITKKDDHWELEELRRVCSEYLWYKRSNNKNPDFWSKQIYKALGKPDWAKDFCEKENKSKV